MRKESSLSHATSTSTAHSQSVETRPEHAYSHEIDNSPGGFTTPSGSSSDISKRNQDADGPTSRLWLSTFVAGVVAIPLSILLSFGAALPFFLGLFFFALFGLVIGATGFRVGQKFRPYPRPLVIMATAIIIGWCMGISLVKEAVDFPSDMASQALVKTKNIGERTSDQYQADVANEVRSMLAKDYAPGGIVGYFKWVTTNGTIKKDTLPSVDRGLRAGYSRILWFIRLVLSTALLTFGVASQMMLLAKPAPKPKA